MEKDLTFLGGLKLSHRFKSLVAIGVIFMVTGCTYSNQVTMDPKVGKLEITKPIPLEAGLLITEESKKQIFRSGPNPAFQFNYPVFFLEPYQLPIGEAFEKAAVQVFSQVFLKVHPIRSLDEARNYPLVLEPKLTGFDFRLVYFHWGMWPPYTGVDIQGQAKVSGTLISQGRKIWEKTIEPPLGTRYQVYTELAKNTVGEEASERIIRALQGLALKMVEESTVMPSPPYRGWLQEMDQSKQQ